MSALSTKSPDQQPMVKAMPTTLTDGRMTTTYALRSSRSIKSSPAVGGP